MRKLIRFSALAFLVWAVIAMAWASVSHITGLVGPARASAASLEFVASAMTLADPPGALGAPQRFVADQIRHVARAVERAHSVPERVAAGLADAAGHRHAHHGRLRVQHRHRVRIASVPAAPIPIDALEGPQVWAGRSETSPAPSAPEAEIAWEGRRSDRDVERIERQRAAVERAMERVADRLARLESRSDRRSELGRRIEEKLREILRDLETDLDEVRVEGVEAIAEIEGLEALELFDGLDLDRPVRIRILSR